MEINERPRRSRKRRFPRDESAQPSAFPVSSEPAIAEEINADSEEKKKIAAAAAAVPEIFSPSDVIWCFDVYVALLSFLYSTALKTDFDAIEKELSFSDEQKELMSKPLSRILSKHAPAEWAANKDEIQLVVMLGVFTASSFSRARKVAKDLEEERRRNQDITRPVDPMRKTQPIREAHVPA